MHISIVTPVYKAEEIIPELYKRLVKSLEKITDDFEIIMVNDGSPGNDWEVIKTLAENDIRVKGINLSRNFGQHNAITAGLEKCSGEWVIVMDCDLQDQPEEILNLYKKTKEGFDIVWAKRTIRKDGLFKRTFSKLFYKTFSYLTDTKQDHTIANFGIYNKKVIKSILMMHDYVRVFPILVQWVGFSKTSIDINHNNRLSGKSSYNFSKLFKLSLNMIISFSEKPLKLGMIVGIFVSFISFFLGIYYFILFLQGKILVPGYTSLIIAIAFSTGIIMSFLGLVGLYIGKINTQIKNRPIIIIKEII